MSEDIGYPQFDPALVDAALAAEIKNFADVAKGPDAQHVAGMLNAHVQYWKFCPDESCVKPGHVERRGHIVVGPSLKAVKAGLAHEAFRTSKHAVPLPQYGQYEVGYDLHSNYSPQNPFGRFTQIVTKPGGIHEFPAEQILELGWHRNPVIAKARPDIAGHVDVPCPFGCRGRKFVSQDDMRSHVEAVHRDQMVSTALGEQISAPMNKIAELITAQNASGNISAEQAMVMATAIVAALQAQSNQPATIEEDFTVGEEESEVEKVLLGKTALRGRKAI